MGSGFIITDDGYIVTNNHVIEGADSIIVKFKGTNEEFDADILGTDKKTDLALLKIDAEKKLPFVEFDTTNSYKEGDWVVVVGNPFNLGVSVSTGIISATNRDLGLTGIDNFIQTDAAINRGNSGGPMFNLQGKVIGVNSAIFSPSGGSVGVGFAIPSSTVLPIIQELKDYGFIRRSWIGISAENVDEETSEALNMRQPYGVIVTDVDANGPAQESGILVSDLLLYIDKDKIEDLTTLQKIIDSKSIGDIVSIKFLRKGGILKADLTIGATREEDNYDSKYESIVGSSFDFMGMQLIIITNEVKEYFGIDKSINGMYVLSVKEQSVAGYEELTEGDIILSINQTVMDSKESLKNVLKDAEKNNRSYIMLMVKRTGNVFPKTLPLKSSLLNNKRSGF
jgi:serine protease Do